MGQPPYIQVFNTPRGEMASVVLDLEDFEALIKDMELKVKFSGVTELELHDKLMKCLEAKHIPLMARGSQTAFIFERFDVKASYLSVIVRGEGANVLARLLEKSLSCCRIVPMVAIVLIDQISTRQTLPRQPKSLNALCIGRRTAKMPRAGVIHSPAMRLSENVIIDLFRLIIKKPSSLPGHISPPSTCHAEQPTPHKAN